MAIIPVSRDDIENFTIVTTPRRTFAFSSGSFGQRVTGSIRIYPRFSEVNQKSTDEPVATGPLKDKNFLNEYEGINSAVRQIRFGSNSSNNATGKLENYFGLVSSASIKFNHTSSIERFSPLDFYTDNEPISRYTMAKNTVKDVLMPHYRTSYPNANWSYTNYHSLNFFTVSKTSQTIPTSSVLIYPNIQNKQLPVQAGHVSGTYCLSGAFTFDFYINPRYQTDSLDTGHFKAGTIFHLSSSYALSLVTGSSKGPTGAPDGFRLQLQLSHSADISPSHAVQGSYPSNLVFLSDDNCLSWNKWHHVVVRWGTNSINDGTGSFVIDGIEKGYFVVPSGTINPRSTAGKSNPDALCIGNFYEGTNTGLSSQAYFFTYNIARANGTQFLLSGAAYSNIDQPAAYSFNHPLKAEVHNLNIRRKYLFNDQIAFSSSLGVGGDANNQNLFAFCLPPFFVQESAIRRKHKTTQGGVLQTPYHTISGTTDDPFNVSMAFGVNGHYINLENFTRDFTNVQYPRLIDLTGSAQSAAGQQTVNANRALYASPGVSKRNLTILPCDNGNFEPNYELLRSERYIDKYRTISGSIIDWSAIYLDDLLSSKSFVVNSSDPSSQTFVSWSQDLYGATPSQPGVNIGPKLQNFYNQVDAQLSSSTSDANFNRGVLKGLPLPIYQSLRDASSNQVTIFNISNLYYGRRIQPGSFTLTDASISGSEGAVKITLKDDSLGGLYRADALTKHSIQNCVGNIFYDEGIVLIKNPHLFFFGKQQYEMSFKGISNIYSTKYEILAGSSQLNSSSNSSYARQKDAMRPSGDPADKSGFIYITGINLHDENMNIVARTKLAQPIIKRVSDKVLFKIAIDM